MKEQILKLLSYFNISATQFAEEIGVQRSSISHILSGRNKPSYDFIIKILDKYPDVNPSWLLTGNGEMIMNTNSPSKIAGTGSEKIPGLFKTADKTENNKDYNEKHSENSLVDISKQQDKVTNINDIESVIILYTNGTFYHYKKK